MTDKDKGLISSRRTILLTPSTRNSTFKTEEAKEHIDSEKDCLIRYLLERLGTDGEVEKVESFATSHVFIVNYRNPSSHDFRSKIIEQFPHVTIASRGTRDAITLQYHKPEECKIGKKVVVNGEYFRSRILNNMVNYSTKLFLLLLLTFCTYLVLSIIDYDKYGL